MSIKVILFAGSLLFSRDDKRLGGKTVYLSSNGLSAAIMAFNIKQLQHRLMARE